MRSQKFVVGVVLPLLSAATCSAPVWAQSTELEEVIITAQRRTEDAQKTPIAIDVYTDEDFVREGVRDVKDLQKLSTALYIPGGGAQLTQLGIRGILQPGAAPNGSTVAAVHLDGVFQNSGWGLNGLMYDVGRVEVLAGPQGTLYGRNTSAGAINLITKRPSSEFEGNATVEMGAYNYKHYTGGVSIPMGDAVSTRLAFVKNQRDAMFQDGTSATDIVAVRAGLQWKITPSDTLFATIDYGSNDSASQGSTLYKLDPDVRAVTSVSATGVPTYSATAVPASISNYTVPSDLRNNVAYQTARGTVSACCSEQQNTGWMLEYTHEFSAFTSTLQGSHRQMKGYNVGATKTPAQYSANINPANIITNVVELRFVSSQPGALQWVGGLFGMTGDVKGWNATPSQQTARPDPETDLNIDICPCSTGGYPNNSQNTAWAAYGQGTWVPPSMQKFHLTAGLRYNHDYAKYQGGFWASNIAIFAWGIPDMPASVRPLFAGVRDSAIDASGKYVPDRSWNKVQWRLGAQYDLNDVSMVYASVSTGYKSGALVAGPTPETKPETVLAYEVGSKNRFFNNSLQVNLSGWYYDYTDLEQATNRPLGYQIVLPNGTISSTTVSRASVGKVRLIGVSGDVSWNATASDQFGLSFTNIQSRVIDGFETDPLTGLRNQILNEGVPLGATPRWTTVGRYSHDFRFSSGASLDAQVKYNWKSEQWNRSAIPGNAVPVGGSVNIITGAINTSRVANTNTIVPAYGLLDLSFRFSPASNRWSATAYVNNALDNINFTSIGYTDTPGTYNATTRVFTPNATYGHYVATLGDPRLWGLAVDFKF